MPIVTLDFEASCLPRHGRSFPIEVGVARNGQVQSWLIRPHPTWHGWDWTDEAQALHGLTRARIERDGVPAAQVLAELTASALGHRVVADSLLDQYWLDTLAQAAGVPVPFAIDHVATLFDAWRVGESEIAAAVAHADAQGIARHSAAGDALWLATLVARLAGVDAGVDALVADQTGAAATAPPLPVLVAAR